MNFIARSVGLFFIILFLTTTVFAVTPQISGVDTNAVSGTYSAGDVIFIRLNYNPSNIDVNVDLGTPTLQMNSGGVAYLIGTCANNNYSSCSSALINNKYVLFQYIIGAGENANPLALASTNALQLNGGRISLTGDSSDANIILSSSQLALGTTITVLNPDTVAPVTTASGYSTSWAMNQSVTLTCSDIGNGCYKTFYSYNGTDYNAVAPIIFNANIDGNLPLVFHSVDNNGNIESNKTIYLAVDSVDPVILVPANISAEATSASGAVVSYDANASDALSGMQSFVCAPVSNSTFALGTTNVDCNAIDNANNLATASFDVNVVDTTSPILTVPVNQVTEATSPSGAIVNFIAIATDLVDTSVDIICTPSSGSTFALGTTQVSCNAIDDFGNNSGDDFNVIIVDTNIPLINLTGINPQVIEVLSPYTELGATASDLVNGDLTSAIVIDTSDVNILAVGSYTVTYDVNDLSNNSAVQVTRTVNVVDTTSPSVSITTPLDSEVTSPTFSINATYSDNVEVTGIEVFIDSISVGNSVPLIVSLPDGVHTIVVEVTDAAGNTASDSVDIYTDVTGPVITVPVSVTEEATPSGNSVNFSASVSATDAIDGSVSVDCVPLSGSTFLLGTTQVDCTAVDSKGNVSNASFNVIIEDTTSPVITLIGADPQTIKVFSSYTELGASATDSYDGNLTGLIVIDSASVNTTIVGLYIVTYDVTDSSGNLATQVARIVNVVDTTIPSITLLGADPQVIEAGDSYVELGAFASDNYDGDISPSIVIDSSSVNTGIPGTYYVTYNVDDSSFNSALEVTRTVNVVDTTPPLISVPVSVIADANSDGMIEVSFSATATDIVDGSTIVSCNPISGSSFSVGTTTVDCESTDNAGNTSYASFDVIINDADGPVLTLPSNITAEVTSPSGASVTFAVSAYDVIDGSIAPTCNYSSGDTFVLGITTVDCSATDSALNTSYGSFDIEVVDTTPPVITLDGSDPQYVEVGTSYSESGATASDIFDGDLTSSIVIDDSNVNTSLLGIYYVTYDVTDSEGNNATQVSRTIIVQDTTVPVLSLIGADPQVIEVGFSYIELGANASDNYDGNLDLSVIINSSSVNTLVLGSYTVTYDVTDSSSNSATQITRTVNVVDTTAPVIVLNGSDPITLEVGSVYVEDGAVVVDNYDANSAASVSGSVDTNLVGVYTIFYDGNDSSNNSASQVTRTVNIVDTTAPVITLLGSNPQVITTGNAYVELGATASDNYDANLDANIVINSSAVNTSVAGDYNVYYDVNDSSGNSASTVTRIVTVQNAPTPPNNGGGSNGPRTGDTNQPTIEEELVEPEVNIPEVNNPNTDTVPVADENTPVTAEQEDNTPSPATGLFGLGDFGNFLPFGLMLLLLLLGLIGVAMKYRRDNREK